MSLDWMLKLASNAPTTSDGGHWRKLDPGEKGKDQAGSPTQERTWVQQNRMKADIKPFPHQEQFIQAVRDNIRRGTGGGVIAAHGTGTGKTLSAIAAFEDMKGDGKARRALVVTPAGLRGNFLEKGVKRFTTSKGEIQQRPGQVSDDTEYVVTSYDAFRRDPDKWLSIVQPDTLIADEMHRAANPGSRTFQTLRDARAKVPNFLGLTASISQNDPGDIVPLLDIATGGEQKIKSKKEFTQRYVKRSPSETRGVFGGPTYEKNLVRQVELNARVGGTVHYVEDLDASSKPSKEVEHVKVDMSPEQEKLYTMSMKGIDPVILKKIQEGSEISQKEALNFFTRLMRARQISNSMHIASAGMSLEDAAEKTPKIKRILDDAVEHIGKIPDGQVVMYTNMVHGGVDVLTAGLKKRGISYGLFAGKGVEGMTEENRQKAVEDYLAGKHKVIIITGAGAEGLSLGNTTMVQLVDGHYNPERIAQAEARGIRAGGLSHRPQEERKVAVRRYVSALPKTFWQKVTFQDPKRSVEQYVYLTAERKERLNRQLRDVLKNRTSHEQKKRDSALYKYFGGGP